MDGASVVVATRFLGHAQVAALLTGGDYPLDGPLFWYAREELLASGWDVAQADTAVESPAAVFDALAEVANGRLRCLVSMGQAARVALDPRARCIPGMWLAPPLVDTSVFSALSDCPGPGLLVGSPSDPSWSVSGASRVRQLEVLQLADADRRLEVPGDPMRSLEMMRRLLDRFRALLAKIDAGRQA